jgi:hypothetical protein
MLSVFKGGLEMYDQDTKPPDKRPERETLYHVEKWVDFWYLSVYEDGETGRIVGRYINKDPGKRSKPVLEQPVRDSKARIGRYSLKSFAETVMHGEEPD